MVPVANGHAPGHLFIGTSGWSYDLWAESFYAGVPRTQWLAHYARHFNAVEIDASFYHEVRPETFRRWYAQTPAHFRFAIKAHRYLTHVKRLNCPPASVERQRDNAGALGDKLAVVLWQLPERMQWDLDRLRQFAATLELWPHARHAIEFRHASWFVEPVAQCLRQYRIAVCLSDAADWPLWDEVTTDLVYVRLHGHTLTYSSGYSDPSLARWAIRVRQWRAEGHTVHIYFDNTDAGHAPRDAQTLAARLHRQP